MGIRVGGERNAHDPFGAAFAGRGLPGLWRIARRPDRAAVWPLVLIGLNGGCATAPDLPDAVIVTTYIGFGALLLMEGKPHKTPNLYVGRDGDVMVE